MSGGLFFFFWDPDAPVAPPPPPPPPDPGAGGGAGRGTDHVYIPFSDQYWDTREIYLQSLFDRTHPQRLVAEDYERRANAEYEARKQQLEELNAERATLILKLRHCTTVAEMKDHGARILAINAKIHELMGKQAVSRFMH